MSTVHPIFGKTESFKTAEGLRSFAQLLLAAYSMRGCLAHGLGRYIGFMATLMSPLALIIYVPDMIYSLIRGEEKEGKDLKIRWLFPLCGMAAMSALAHLSFTRLTSNILKGIVTGIHAVAVGTIANGAMFGGFSLKGALITGFLDRKKFVEKFDYKTMRITENTADDVTAIAFLTANLALTYLTRNPILADAISYPIAAAIKPLALYIFGTRALAQTRAA